MEHGEEVVGVPLPTGDEPAIVMEPGEEPAISLMPKG